MLLAFTSVITGTAAADVTLSVTPSLVELSATPGGQGEVDLQVTNNGSESFDVRASVQQSKGGGGDLSAVDWLAVQPSEFRLAPGEHQAVMVTVAVPSPLDSGGRYGTVMLKTGVRAVAGTGIGVAGQVGVPFLIDVHGDGPLVRTAGIDQLVPVIMGDGGIGFASSLVNRGNVHVVAAGSVVVERLDGTPVGSLQLPEITPLLPRNTVVMKTLDSLLLTTGATYLASASVDYGGSAPAVSDTRFTVRAGLAIGDVGVGEGQDEGPTFRVALNNSGSVRDRAGLAHATGRVPRACRPLRERHSLVDAWSRLTRRSADAGRGVRVDGPSPLVTSSEELDRGSVTLSLQGRARVLPKRPTPPPLRPE
jgi:hypothetical protein